MTNPERIVFDSFLHSQGDPRLQYGMLRYMELQDFITKEQCFELLEAGIDRFLNYASGPSHIPNDKNPVRNKIIDDIIDGESAYPDDDQLLLRLGGGILLGDHLRLDGVESALARRSKYKDSNPLLKREFPQPRPKRAVYAGRLSPSHLLLFGVCGVTTKVEAFDLMYKDLIAEGNEHLDSEELYETAKGHIAQNQQDAAAILAFIGQDTIRSVELRKAEKAAWFGKA